MKANWHERFSAEDFQYKTVPTLILFKDGKSVWRQSGVVPAHTVGRHHQTVCVNIDAKNHLAFSLFLK